MPHRRHRRHLPEHHHRYEHPGVKHSGRGYHGFDDYDVRREFEDGYEYEEDEDESDYEYSDEPLNWDYEDRRAHRHSPGNSARSHRWFRENYPDYRMRGYNYGGGRSYGSNYGPGNYERLHRPEYPRPRQYPEDIHGDMRHYQGYSGYGPKNWTRPDQRISDEINECLTEDRYLDARGIEITVKNGDVTLSGSVESRQAKRHAEDIAEQVSGVKQIQNDLRVAAAPEEREASSKSRSLHKSS